MAEKTPERSLHRKLAQVMHEVGRIPKNGTAPREMGGYKFVQVGDAADAIRKALADALITMMPVGVQVTGQQDRPTKSGGSMTTVDLVTTWRLTDAESGEFIDIQSFGAGADGGDKYSGKASTSAMKYALLTGFLLSTGEDSELGNNEPTVPRGVEKPTGDIDPNEPEQTGDGEETVEFLGMLQKVGTIQRGGASKYQARFLQTPEGHAFGFRLKLTDDRDIPQVLITAAYGDALFLAYVGEDKGLLGAHVTVKGRLYNVRQPGRRTYNRLIVGEGEKDFIETPVVRIPALEPATETAAEPAEAPSEPLFSDDEQAAIDAAMEKAS